MWVQFEAPAIPQVEPNEAARVVPNGAAIAMAVVDIGHLSLEFGLGGMARPMARTMWRRDAYLGGCFFFVMSGLPRCR